MNQTLMLELARKVMQANALYTRYTFTMDFNDYSFHISALATHTVHHTTVTHEVATYDAFKDNYSLDGMEIALNNAIAQMTNFIRYKDFPSVINLLIAKNMMEKLKEFNHPYKSDEIFEYFGIDPQVVGGVINATA